MTSLRALLDARRAAEEQRTHSTSPIPQVQVTGTTGKVNYNEEQKAAIALAQAGKSFVLTGSPGTGKTTTAREIVRALLTREDVAATTHTFGSDTASAMAAVAYTRTAAGNIRAAVAQDPTVQELLSPIQVTTIHKLLEFAPSTETVETPEGEWVTRFRFLPRRTASNPLTLKALLIDESTLVGSDLWEQLFEALPEGCQIIFIGDINQLPPVFGAPILAYALLQLPVVELTKVYRQAEESAIISAAHNILRGQAIAADPDRGLVWQGTDQTVTAHRLVTALGKFWERTAEDTDPDSFTPGRDMVISPYNKGELGTIAINAAIAQIEGQRRDAVVTEVIAGFAKHYLAVGDIVLVRKQRGVITEISRNGQYMGASPVAPSASLTRWGTHILGGTDIPQSTEDTITPMAYDSFQLPNSEEMESRATKASHIVTILLDDGETLVLETAGDFAPAAFQLGYALTAHKAIGQEWPQVMVLLHHTHRTAIYREWLYTAITRARERTILVANRQLVERAIKTPRAKGNTLDDKIAHFTERLEMNAHIRVTK